MFQLYLPVFIKLVSFLLLPGFFWVYLFAGGKRIFKNSKKALIPVFVLGVVVSFPAIAIEHFSTLVAKLIKNRATIFVSTIFIVGPTEEYLKALAVDIGGYAKGEKGSAKQILAWYLASAIGFASIENVLYYLVFGSKVYVVRVILTTLAHVCCSGIIGLFVGNYLNSEKSGFFRGFLLASVVHGLYDYTLSIYQYSLWIWIPILLIFAAFLEGKLDS